MHSIVHRTTLRPEVLPNPIQISCLRKQLLEKRYFLADVWDWFGILRQNLIYDFSDQINCGPYESKMGLHCRFLTYMEPFNGRSWCL